MKLVGGSMFSLARLLFLGAWAGGWLLAVCAVVIGFAVAPEAGIVLLLVLIVAAVHGGFRKTLGGGVLGSAAWGTIRDVMRRGAVGNGGLPVGTLSPPTRKEAFAILRQAHPFMSREACRVIFSWWTKRRLPVSFHDFVNVAVISPPGAGKTTAVIIPALLSLPWSAVAVDVKGEVCAATVQRRKRMGSRVAVLDPFGCTGLPGAKLNPLWGLNYAAREVTDRARQVAESLVTRTGKEVEAHWNDMAVVLITAVILYVVARSYTLGSRDDQTLAAVFTTIADPNKLDAAMGRMQTCLDHAGVLSDLAFQVNGLQGKEKASVVSSALRALSFTQTAVVKEVTAESTFDPARLRSGFLTVYLCIPPTYLKSHAGLVRVWLNALMTAVVEAGADRHARVLFALDEYAALGRMEVVEQALTQFRGYGTRLLFAFQTASQIDVAFPDGGKDHVLANCSQVYMGVRDYPTAKLVSDCVGQQTVLKHSASGGMNSGHSYGQDGAGSRSFGSNDGWSVDQVARELIKPEEVLQLGDRRAVVLHGNLPPLLVQIHRHYERGYADAFEREPSAFGMLLRAAVAFAVAAAVAGGLAAFGLPEAAKVGEQYRQQAVEMNRTPPPGMRQQQQIDPDQFDPGVVKDAFGQVARDRNGVAIRIPSGMHVEHDPRTGTAWLVRNGDRMFR